VTTREQIAYLDQALARADLRTLADILDLTAPPSRV